jgi:hypothetical protein
LVEQRVRRTIKPPPHVDWPDGGPLSGRIVERAPLATAPAFPWFTILEIIAQRFGDAGDVEMPAPIVSADPFSHPDALRRIRPIADQEELEQALAFPWEKWDVFL